MNLRQYVIVFVVGSLIAGIAWILVLIRIDPSTASALAFMSFYISLFIFFSGSMTSVLTVIRSLFPRKKSVEYIVTTSLRQGILLAILFISALILLSFNLLLWWTAPLLILSVGIVEAGALLISQEKVS